MKALPILLLSSLSLGGCTQLGPDFLGGRWDKLASWNKPSVPEQYSLPELQPLTPQWWKLLQDPLLSKLQEQVLTHNLDVRTAQARLLQSRAQLQSIRGEAVPKVDANAFVQRQRNSNSGRVDQSGREGKEAYNHGYADLQAFWELDFWGHVQRQIEAAEASSQAVEEALHGVQLLILSDTASHYIQLRSEQRFEQVLLHNRALAQQHLELTQLRFENGVATQLEVAQAEALLAGVEARLPASREHQAHLINALSLLIAAMPDSLRAELQTPQDIPQPPAHIPLGFPSELAQRRPDIREAEARLHATTAQIGVAQADFYPRITLNGGMGFESSRFLPFEWKNRLYLLGTSFYMPIFEGGRLKGRLALREAEQQEAAIQYQQRVLKAWHEVDDALNAYSQRQQQHLKWQEATQHREQVLENSRQQYLAGAVDFLHVLEAQQDLLTTEEQQIRSQESVSLGFVSLYKALGGGWQDDFGQQQAQR